MGELYAQPKDTARTSQGYSTINESKLADTKWRYAYTTYSGSSTPIHTADENFSHYIWLKFDYTYEQVLNGKRSTGMWALNDKKNRLYYKFKNTKWWEIVSFKDDKLILEFADMESSLQYTFQRIGNDVAPFSKDKNLLPSASIYDKNGKKVAPKTKSLSFFDWLAGLFLAPEVGARAKDTSIVKPRYDPNNAPAPIDIDIALVGGGFYGGVDPTIRNFINIKTTGRVIHEIETENKGLMKFKKDMSRKELENLVRFIIEKRFFDLDGSYDCETGDCKARKGKKPKPVPLRLTVQYGDRKKTVSIGIWGKEGNRREKYVEYPAELDLIIENILLAANATNL